MKFLKPGAMFDDRDFMRTDSCRVGERRNPA
jgi:hypothetical protein